jgi:hypothetical protein
MAPILLAKDSFQVIDFTTKQETACDTGNNTYETPFANMEYYYEMKYLPEMNIMVLFAEYGGKFKLIDLNRNQMIQKCSYGRPGAKFGNFMLNMLMNVAFNYPIFGYGYNPIYVNNFFNGGSSVIVDPQRAKYFILSQSTRDVTVFDNDFKNPKYILTPENPIAMFQLSKSKNPQIWLVTNKKIYLINPDDLSLKPIYDFQMKISNCVFLKRKID